MVKNQKIRLSKKRSKRGEEEGFGLDFSQAKKIAEGLDNDLYPEIAQVESSNNYLLVWSKAFGHYSVLLLETIEALAIKPDGFYVDATLGAGGYSRAILEKLGPNGRLLAIDIDPEPLRWASLWGAKDSRLIVKQLNFGDLADFLSQSGLGPADGLAADLGLNSRQLLDPSRGFSFNSEAALDMRLDPSSPLTAFEIVNSWSTQDLKTVFERVCRPKLSEKIAQAIVESRKKEDIKSPKSLALIIESALGLRPWVKTHPATLFFLALRLEVNSELKNLNQFLVRARECLKPKGRLVTVSFHSLEDAMVKRAIFGSKEDERNQEPLRVEDLKGKRIRDSLWRPIYRKVVKPTAQEINLNPRARSARLRAAEAI
ncbi:MAG: 16S rRNA (cytosine(1402)-N(4))-methyltransferase RsmH [Deltaproteobacteria bacterium]|jgi:16S rRNA (cytosine1402-N4)-methyltransferase|nr:16S rRNA (cytosine(1402)-N(4))-methyltransferase RsmH [Deltaproteobacteria bacterium]